MIRFISLFLLCTLSFTSFGQDLCSGANDWGTLSCGDNIADSGDAMDTPDPEATSCMMGLVGTWFTFTTDASLSEITLSGPDYELFEGSCGSLNYLNGCSDGLVIAADPNLQYYLLVNGDISLDTPLPPSNDDCSNAINATGGITGEDNSCSDVDDGFCGSDGNASVWYSYTVDTDLELLEINVVSNGISSPALAFYDNCGSQLLEDCGPSLSATCVVPGTYYIQVGSDYGNTGGFDLDISETSSSVSNDNCDSAEDVTPAGSCAFETVSGDSSGACPESSDFGSGCGFDVNPTVWFSFSTGPNATNIDLENLSSNLELIIMEGSCSGPVTSCITSNTNVAVSSNTDYFIAASLTSGGGSFEFDLSVNEPPENDACSNAAALGSGEGLNTCCGVIEGIDECGGSETGVWFEYLGPDGDGSLYSFSNIDMSGNIGIEIYEGSCGGLSLITEPYCGSASSYSIEVPNCGADMHFIHVTSSDGGCGSFDLDVTPLVACAFGEECGDGPTISPSTGGGEDCVAGCNQFACDSDCAEAGVWFIVETDELATEMTVVVNDVGGSNVDPVVTIIQAECSGGALVACNDVASGDITEVAVSGGLTYLIEVSTGSGGTPGDFEVCVATTESLVQCSDGTIEPTRPEYPDADPLGPYCPGEIVNFCYDVTFTVDPIGQGNNCQWIQGIIPTVGGGWDLDALTLDSQGPGGTWFWLDEAEVEYQAPSSVLGIINTPYGLGLEYGPGTLADGDLLPGGWWATSNGGGANCTNDGNPNTMWGLPASCGSSQDVSFCFDLQVRELSDVSECDDPDVTDLKVHIFTMADGQTGCWSNNSCSGDIPVTFNAQIDCTSLVFVDVEDGEICNNGVLDLLVETEDGSSTDIIVEVLDEGNTSGATNWEFTGGSGVITDQIENEGDDVEILLYEAYASDPNSICEGPRTTIEVIVYPEIEIDVEDPYYICYQAMTEVTPIVSGGTGGPYEYLWEDGSDEPSIELPETEDQLPGEYTVSLLVTDDFGCTKEEIINYEIVEPVIPMIINPYIGVCKDGFEDLPELFLEFESVGTGPYEYLWTANPGGLEFENGDNDPSLIINEEESSARTYTIFGTVIDDYGCEYTTETELTVDNGPDLSLEVEECFGTAFMLTGYDDDGLLVNFQLFFDEEGDWLYDGMTILNAEEVAANFGDVINYLAEDYGTYILLGTSTNGCSDYVELELPPVPLPEYEVLPNDTICAGTQITVSVLNSNEYVNYNWSNGESGSSFVDTPSDTITYYLVAETPEDCEIVDSLTVVVNPLPQVTITGSRAICPGSETILTAQGDMGYSYLWTGPNGEMITTQTANISVAGDWTIMIVSNSGCMNSDVVTVEENAQLNPEISGSNICTGSSAILDGGPGFDEYEWVDSGGMVIGTDQTLEVFAGGDYTLNVVLGAGASACTGTDDYTVLQFDPVPDALTSPSTELCNIDNGSLSTTVDLTSFETGVSGTWFDNNNLPVANPQNVDFENVNPGSYEYTFVSNEAMAPCVDESFSFDIIVQDCRCPSVDIGRLPDFCIGVDTFNLNLIKKTNEPGVWSINNASISIEDSLMILDDNTTAGEVFLTYSLTGMNIPPSCETDSTVNFTVFERLSAELLDNVRVCNEDTGNGADFIDLDDLYVSGDQGVWTSNDPSLIIDADNVVSFAGAAIDNYRFFYYMEDTLSACPPVSISTEIEVIDCSCPSLEIMPLEDLCDSGGTLTLNDFLVNPENIAGTWSINGPDDSALIGSSIFSSGREAGEYEVIFSFTNPVGGSCINSASQTMTIYERPTATVSPEEFACNGTNITVYPTILNLFDYVQGSTGDWTAGPEYNGGVLNDATQVDFEGLNPGIYSFTYTTNTAVAPCEESSYLLEVTVRNCNCPFVDFIPPTPLCNDGPDVDLNDYLPADAEPGVWSFVNGNPSIDLVGSTVFSLSDLEGFYLFQYTLDEVPQGCPDLGQISIEIVAPPEVQHTPEDDVCSVQSVIADNCIDLNDYISGVPGSWTLDPTYDGDGSDVSNICFDSEDPGEVLFFVFNTETGSVTCDERQYVTTFTVLDCNCPYLGLMQAPRLCNTELSFDLSTLEEIGIEDGSWQFIDGPQSLSINNDILDIEDAITGSYTLRYIPDESPSIDCDQYSELQIDIVDMPDPGQVINSGDCLSDGDRVLLEDYLINAEAGGEWSLGSEVLPTDSQGNTYFTADGDEAGVYNFNYGFYGNDPCMDSSVELIFYVQENLDADVIDSPCADANGGSIIVASVGTGNGNLYSIDGGLNWGTNSVFENLEPGNYTLMIEDENGCIMSLEDIIVSEPGPFSVDAGEDREIEEGPGFTNLQLASNLDVSEIVYIEWTENGTVICSGSPDQCWSIDVNPNEIAEYCATVTDINGCVTTDCVIIRERLVKDVYIPNIFNSSAPNNDGVFFVQADQYVELINEFRIYDRWGNLVFEAEPNHKPNEKQYGWDGTMNDRSVEQGVYVYVISLTYTDGETEIFAGDITLLND